MKLLLSSYFTDEEAEAAKDKKFANATQQAGGGIGTSARLPETPAHTPSLRLLLHSTLLALGLYMHSPPLPASQLRRRISHTLPPGI